MGKRAVFLDKDGTLIPNVPYNVNPDLIELRPGAQEGLLALHQLGYALIVVSNQAGVARGYFPEHALAAVEARLRAILGSFGVPLAGFYYCPHHPNGTEPRYAIACDCRKPEPGLLLRSATEHSIDLAASWFIGDVLNDVEAGRRAGCKTILVDDGEEADWRLTRARLPHHIVADLGWAARIVAALDQPVSGAPCQAP